MTTPKDSYAEAKLKAADSFDGECTPLEALWFYRGSDFGRAYSDKQNEDKLKKLYRVAASYDLRTRGALCGQAFTNYVCIRCDQEKSHENTNIPTMCKGCFDLTKKEYQNE